MTHPEPYTRFYLKGLLSLCIDMSKDGNSTEVHRLANFTQFFQGLLNMLDEGYVDLAQVDKILQESTTLANFKQFVHQYEKRKKK